KVTAHDFGIAVITVAATKSDIRKSTVIYAVVGSVPFITAAVPSSGPAGTMVTIKGINLREVATVRFDGVPAPIISASSTSVISVNAVFAAVNRGTRTATMNLTLRDLGGRTLATGSIQLAPNAHMAKFIDGLGPDFILPAGFSSIGFGSLDVTSDIPVSILAL